MIAFTIITAFLAILLGGIGYYRTSSRFTVEKRIEQIMTSDSQTTEEELARPFVQRVLLPIGDSMAKLFRGYTPAEMAERTHKKLVMAGLYPRVTAVQLVGLCWFSAAGTRPEPAVSVPRAKATRPAAEGMGKPRNSLPEPPDWAARQLNRAKRKAPQIR